MIQLLSIPILYVHKTRATIGTHMAIDTLDDKKFNFKKRGIGMESKLEPNMPA